MFSQQKFFTFNDGYIEGSLRYNGLITPVNPAYKWQFNINYEENINIDNIPATIQSSFTNLILYQHNGYWYPNYIRISYKKDNFQKLLQNRYINILEQKVEQEQKKNTKKRTK